VEDKLANAVGEAIDVARREFSGDVFDARYRIDVCSFAAEEFGKSLV
jgi:hypothetical protein